ncbi:ABC-three component system middle component 1 [Clostridium sp. C8-1-8]|uniref:ABC-three component system middle component 1 n=1 Tax=Clostridium sp. C8-1-8 TaxID=2698831 RepID=UPI00136C66F4|nr:ABC-three component system middle component 1 [Clostridium sp. C8-1-8]
MNSIKYNTLINRLKDKKFKRLNCEQRLEAMFSNAKQEVWQDNNKVIITKSYTSAPHFLNEWYKDQSNILHLYKILETKFKNNIYFILSMDWERQFEEKLHSEINRVEKNSKLCRKYVICDLSDIERIFFFSDKNLDNGFSGYEKKFRESLQIFQERSNIVPQLRRDIDNYFNLNMNHE